MYSGGINFAQCMGVTLKKRLSKMKPEVLWQKAKDRQTRSAEEENALTVGIEQTQIYRRKKL
jgi:hypothetical protein